MLKREISLFSSSMSVLLRYKNHPEKTGTKYHFFQGGVYISDQILMQNNTQEHFLHFSCGYNTSYIIEKKLRISMFQDNVEKRNITVQLWYECALRYENHLEKNGTKYHFFQGGLYIFDQILMQNNTQEHSLHFSYGYNSSYIMEKKVKNS